MFFFLLWWHCDTFIFSADHIIHSQRLVEILHIIDIAQRPHEEREGKEKECICYFLRHPSLGSPTQEDTMTKKKKTSRPPVSDSKITLSRERLLTITSQRYQARCDRWVKEHTLTLAQHKILKTQQRLILNREAASKSRTRKRRYTEDLLRQNNDLRDYIEELEGLRSGDVLAYISSSQDKILAYLERLVAQQEQEQEENGRTLSSIY